MNLFFHPPREPSFYHLFLHLYFVSSPLLDHNQLLNAVVVVVEQVVGKVQGVHIVAEVEVELVVAEVEVGLVAAEG